MGIIESLRVEMRRRIVGVAEIVPQDQFQREFEEAPDVNSYYIRETLIDMGRTEPSQTSELQTVLCEYDIIVSRNWLNPTATADNLVEKLRAEFNVKNPDTLNITLPDRPDVQAWVREPVSSEAAEQEGDYYRRPVLIYVECLVNG